MPNKCFCTEELISHAECRYNRDGEQELDGGQGEDEEEEEEAEEEDRESEASLSSHRSSLGDDAPEDADFEQKVSRLMAAKQKLRQLQDLVTLVQVRLGLQSPVQCNRALLFLGRVRCDLLEKPIRTNVADGRGLSAASELWGPGALSMHCSSCPRSLEACSSALSEVSEDATRAAVSRQVFFIWFMSKLCCKMHTPYSAGGLCRNPLQARFLADLCIR